jgi:hypothetical protein
MMAISKPQPLFIGLQKHIDSSPSIKHSIRYNFKYNLPNGKNPFKAFYKKYTFKNQKEFGMKIAKNYASNLKLINTLAIAPTQSGKTGSMLALMYHFMEFPYLALPKENIFVITAHSSKEWLEQTKSRFPLFMHNQIYHRNTLKYFIEKVKNLKNVLIIVDECHIAGKYGQSLHNVYDKLDLFNLNNVYEKNIKIVNFTATPECLEDQLKIHWKDTSLVVSMDVPDNYISHEKLMIEGRVFEMKDLCGYNNKTEKIEKQEDIYNNINEIRPHLTETPKYHIIRTPRGKKHNIVIDNFKKVFHDIEAIFVSEPLIKNMDKLLEIKPVKHTFIFIKDKLRCAKTIHKDHLGVLYERYTKGVSSSTILQGLYGRLTGYHSNTNSVVFTKPLSKLKYNFKYNSMFIPIHKM